MFCNFLLARCMDRYLVCCQHF